MSFHSKIGAGTLQYIAQALKVDITGIRLGIIYKTSSTGIYSGKFINRG